MAAQQHTGGGDELKWGPAPPTMPAGASVAVLAGDPAKAGELCILRLKVPNGYRVAPHTHPTDEHLTVLKGTMLYGMGEKLDEAALKPLTAGAHKMTPKEMPHYVTSRWWRSSGSDR
jgi:hypothetical protein